MEALSSIQRAFSKQSEHYDADDLANPVLIRWRAQVYRHVNAFLKPNSEILELNAGTGLDALHFAKAGHRVLATDASPGMINEIRKKMNGSGASNLEALECSFENLDRISYRKFDYVFSNMGGLNCCDDLHKVTRHLPALLRPLGHATIVVMPPACPWEWLWFLKGKNGFRRLQKNGTPASLEGEKFLTHYHGLAAIKKAFGKNFRLLRNEGLGALSPPPAAIHFVSKNQSTARVLEKLDMLLRHAFPFNRWADHLIVTFQYRGK